MVSLSPQKDTSLMRIILLLGFFLPKCNGFFNLAHSIVCFSAPYLDQYQAKEISDGTFHTKYQKNNVYLENLMNNRPRHLSLPDQHSSDFSNNNKKLVHKIKRFVWSEFDSDIFYLSFPALISLLSGPFLSLVDTYFVGKLGTVALGALGPSTMVFNLLFGMYRAVTLATTSLISRALANNNTREAQLIAETTLFYTTTVGVVTALVLKIFPAFFLRLMGLLPTSEIFLQAKSYLVARAVAAPFVLVITVGEGIFRGQSDTLTPTKIASLAAIINLCLDPLFMFQFKWGVSGAAYATVLAQFVSAVTYTVLIHQKGGLLHQPKQMLNLNISKKPLNLQFMRKLRDKIDAGIPILLRVFSANTAMLARYGASVACWSFFTSRITCMGTQSVASHQVASSLWLFLTIAAEALSVAAQVKGGKYFGSGNRKVAKKFACRLWGLSVVYGTIVMWALTAFKTVIASWFTTDAEVITMLCSEILPWVALMQPLTASTLVFEGLLIGAGEFRWLWTTTLFATFSVLVYAARLQLKVKMIWKLLTLLFLFRKILSFGRLNKVFRSNETEQAPFEKIT